MKTVKKITTLLLSFTMIVLLSFSAMAATNQVAPYGVKTNGIEIQPYYLNLSTTYLTCGDTWISADCTTKSKMNIRIDIKVYKNGSLEKTFYTTDYGMSCVFYTDYKFVSGAKYVVEATYTAGSESTTKSVSFTQK